MKKIILTLSIFVSTPIFANSFCDTATQSINQDAANYWQYGSYGENYDQDLYDQYYDIFEKNLKSTLSDNQSWSCDWKDVSGINIHFSPDQKLRSFTWDIGNSGTLHEFATLVQIQNKQGNVKLIENIANQDDGIPAMSKISQMNLPNQDSPIYLLHHFFIGSSRLHAQSIALVKLQNDEIVPANIIKTSKLKNSLNFEYSTMDIDQVYNDDEDTFIQVDSKKMQISIPVVLDTAQSNHMGYVSKNRIIYQYDGHLFQRVKN
ncbi:MULTISPECIES: hypothetical protein [unclassified Acinetobacter]|uniref:hypothetical protein n=1 Tax=unclassified Acinetobacter TaxID=196816 RepID=UPI0035B75165